MQVKKQNVRRFCGVCGIFLLVIALCNAQVSAQSEAEPDRPAASTYRPEDTDQRNIEDFNLVGADTAMPPFEDSIIPVNSSFRQSLLRKGFLLRINESSVYTQNTLRAPVTASDQVFVGERPFIMVMTNPILTTDLRMLRLHGAQLNIGGGLQWVSWNMAGPKAAAFTSLYLFKSIAEGRVEVKAGYVTNDFEFIGLQVGGQVSSGAQGVYAVLPFEAGLSHFAVAAPSFNVKVRPKQVIYAKAGFQRSIDPAGGPAAIARNQVGLRFIPKGDKLLTVFEGGYDRKPDSNSLEMWIRSGYMRNTTAYPNNRTGGTTSGNYCGFFLADRQLTRPTPVRPSEGWYAGFTAMVTPSDMNVYSTYYEARIYRNAPFRRRPGDMFSVVTSHSAYSRYTIANLKAMNHTFWRDSNSVTANYNVHLSHGAYAGGNFSYVTGPAVSPRVANALTFTLQSNIFF